LAALQPRFSPLAFRATLIGMLLAAVAIPLGLAAIPYLEMFNDMAVQPKGKSDGLYGRTFGQSLYVNRMPVAGTLPMDFQPYPFTGKDEEAVKRAESELTNPLVPTMDVLTRGRERYQDLCRTCHGDEALGDGPIIGPGLFPAPPSLHTATARNFQDGRIFHIITRGQNVMPAYADKLSVRDRWAVIHYVRALQRSLDPKPEDLQE
jgi:mono/diheme cytochrome c family protein